MVSDADIPWCLVADAGIPWCLVSDADTPWCLVSNGDTPWCLLSDADTHWWLVLCWQMYGKCQLPKFKLYSCTVLNTQLVSALPSTLVL